MKQYYPSNGSEGDVFMNNNCFNCYKYNQCTILTNAMIGKKPKQWIYNENDIPICTSLKNQRNKNHKHILKKDEVMLF